MSPKKLLVLITIGASLVGLQALGSLNNPVTRPLKAHGHTIVVVSLQDGSFVASEHGQSTLVGQYTTHVEGQMNLSTGSVIWGEGYMESANGDRQFFEMKPQGGLFYITGGTGRFEGATGSATAVNSDMGITLDPSAGTMTLTGSSTIEGTITY